MNLQTGFRAQTHIFANVAIYHGFFNTFFSQRRLGLSVISAALWSLRASRLV